MICGMCVTIITHGGKLWNMSKGLWEPGERRDLLGQGYREMGIRAKGAWRPRPRDPQERTEYR